MPKGTEIERLNKGEGIKFKSNRLDIVISIDYIGTSIALPKDFAEDIIQLDRTEFWTNDIKKVKLTIKVDLKYRLFLLSKWKVYYNWVDIFLDDIDNTFSTQKLFNKIGWEYALTIKRLTEKKNN